jgi:hypothetical protein
MTFRKRSTRTLNEQPMRSLEQAKAKFDKIKLVEAAALLQRYIADPHATKKSEAKQMLADYDLASSQSAAIETLMAMSDQEFAEFTIIGVFDDHKIKDRKLISLRSSTLRRNVKTANQRREEIKLAEANRKKEEAKIADAKRQESERLAQAALRAVANKLDVPGVWLHQPGNSEPNDMALLPNGKINHPDSQDSWSLTGTTLVLRWASPQARGGFWIDTCTVSDDGKSYRGANQRNVPIAGWKEDPEAKSLKARMVGVWRWASGDTDYKFAEDGTFSGRTETGATYSRGGRWRVLKDGTIRLSGDYFHGEVVTMDPDEDKVSIEPNGKGGPFEGIKSQGNGNYWGDLAGDPSAAKTQVAAKSQKPSRKSHKPLQKSPKPSFTKADVAGRWVYRGANYEVPRQMTLHHDGKIELTMDSDPNFLYTYDSAGRNTWTLNGTKLVLRWASRQAPGGFWIDECNLANDGFSFIGHNQHQAYRSGYKGKFPRGYDMAWAKKQVEEWRAGSEHRKAAREAAQARREWDDAHWAELHPSAPRGDGRVQWPDEPKHEAPQPRNSYDPMKGGDPAKTKSIGRSGGCRRQRVVSHFPHKKVAPHPLIISNWRSPPLRPTRIKSHPGWFPANVR